MMPETTTEQRRQPGASAHECGLTICIPVFNEEAAIVSTLQRCLALQPAFFRIGVGGLEVGAVDDGSTDRSPLLANSVPGVQVISHGSNRGYGAALKTGFAAGRHDLIGFLDADGTYLPEAFPRLCQALVTSYAEIVVGSRRAGEHSQMPAVRRLGNWIFATLVSRLAGRAVSDCTSGQRVLRRNVLPWVAQLPDGLDFTAAMSARAVLSGSRVVEVPIPYERRLGRSKLSVVKDGMRVLVAILASALAVRSERRAG